MLSSHNTRRIDPGKDSGKIEKPSEHDSTFFDESSAFYEVNENYNVFERPVS